MTGMVRCYGNHESTTTASFFLATLVSCDYSALLLRRFIGLLGKKTSLARRVWLNA